jgi:hypothetical protein
MHPVDVSEPQKLQVYSCLSNFGKFTASVSFHQVPHIGKLKNDKVSEPAWQPVPIEHFTYDPFIQEEASSASPSPSP